jgi:hypothetical protein
MTAFEAEIYCDVMLKTMLQVSLEHPGWEPTAPFVAVMVTALLYGSEWVLDKANEGERDKVIAQILPFAQRIYDRRLN